MVIKTRKVFEVSEEAKKKGEVKAGCCDWPVTNLYALADNQEEADKLFVESKAGMCGACFCDYLVKEGLQIL